ncbi:NAD-dependent epimerase/dehydratase family protein [Actinoplanes sp. URMC 104]|uniref:NAD-dependent epimerase/dehydratase family protein n=1 Tax=Actinoplanes sp. URMC 104 TaxID=3423409 RepID=UPI003F1BC099
MDPRRVLLTGAQGRVATQLLPALRERWELRLLDHAGGDGDDLGAPLLVGELTDRELLGKALDGVDAVVHLAGNPDPEAPWRELREPNVEGFAVLLDVAHERGVRRVVFASSVHAMGAHEGRRHWPLDPAWPPAPCCSYGATKAFDEALARAYDYRTGLSLIGLRLGLCAPEATPEQAAAGWLRPADLQRIVVGALETDVRFGIYHAVSWGARHRWDLGATMADLGYEPDRDVEDPPATDELITCRP